MKKLFCLSAALLLSVCATPLSAQALQSLDELVKAAGCTPVVDGGTGGTGASAQYHSSYGPEKAFDGVTYSPSDSERWLGSIQNGTYLRYAMPDGYTSPFLLRGYRLHALSCGYYNTERAPQSWELYGHLDANAAADDEGWQLIDTQTDVVWPFTSGDYDASVQGSQFVLEFSVSTFYNYRAFKWVPTKSAQPSSEDTWTVGLMELVFLGYERPADNSVLIGGNQNTVGATTPAYGELSGLASGDTVELSAEEFAYTDTTRYTCIGYTTEIMQDDGSWIMEGTNLVRSATYTHDGQTRRITWLWEEHGYKLNAGLQYGGLEQVTASPEPDADGYYPAGTKVTLDVIAATDPASSFRFWHGDVPAGEQRTLPLTLSMDAPKTVYAEFLRHWKFVDGSTTQVTDGNFVLLLSSNNTALGNGSNTAGNALLAGGGNLDLTNLEAETGVAIKTIGRYSFNSCTSLRSVVLPETVTTLREFTFTGCSALTNMVLSSHVETIGENFVSNCPELRSLSPALPSSLRSLGYRAFYRATALKIDVKLSCPEMTSLPQGLFQESGITSLDMSGSGITTIDPHCAVDATTLTNVVFSPGIESIGEQFAYNATSLRTVTPFLPDTVRHIGWSSFRNTNLTGDLRLANPNGVTLGTDTFRNSKITSADFSASGNTTIAARTFSDCTELASVKLPLRLTTVATSAFSNCPKLQTVDPFLPRYVTTIGESAFDGCLSITNDLTLSSDALASVPNRSFYRIPLKNVTLPKQALTFGKEAFSGCAPNAAFWFYGEAPASVNATSVFNTGSTANPAILYAPRKLDADGWATYTSELTDSDLTKASYPGPATFGVYENSGYRHWLVNWNPPLASGPAMMTVQ